MFHPVGSRPPAVYWRRRLVLLAAVIVIVVLMVMTVRAILGGSGSKAAADAGHHSTPPSLTPSALALTTSAAPPSTAAVSSSVAAPSTSAATSTSSAVSSSSSSAPSASSSAPPAPCQPSQLDVKAISQQPTWKVGEQPVLALQVTNKGPAACVQDVSDSQIVLQVYNGASRVWGSHDCKVEPGTNPETLTVGQPASFSIQWTGLSSEPNCAGTRQRVGAGTYTLYASLAGHQGTATTFAIN